MAAESIIRIILLDDHPLFSEGLSRIISEEKDMNVLKRFTDGDSMLSSREIHQADLLLLDLNLPGKSGLEILLEMKPFYPHLKIICLSMNYTKDLLQKIEKLGGSGYLSKEIDGDELIRMIRTIANSHQFHYFPLAPMGEDTHFSNDNYKLTAREIEILMLIKQNKTTKEISEILHRSQYTIETHRKNLLRKTNTHSILELISLAQKKGWI